MPLRLISRGVNWFRLRTKPFGFLRFATRNLDWSEILELRLQCQEKSLQEIASSNEEIFQWPSFYNLFERRLLGLYRSAEIISAFDYWIVGLCKRIFSLVDLCRYGFSPISRHYRLYRRDFGNPDSAKTFIVYTGGQARTNLYRRVQYFHVIDVLLSLRPPVDDYREQRHIRLTRRHWWAVIGLKLAYPYVDCRTIEHTLVGGDAFADLFVDLQDERRELRTLLREGPTPINRMLLEKSAQAGIASITLYTNSIVLPQNAPARTDLVITNSRSGGSYLFESAPPERTIVSVGDNPHIDWRSLARRKPDMPTIGFLPDQGYFFYAAKCDLDLKILAALQRFPNLSCRVRPHPQDYVIHENLDYYQRMVASRRGLLLDDSMDIDAFLDQVSLVIVTGNSTTAEVAVLCKKPLIVVGEASTPVNQALIERAPGMTWNCSGVTDTVAAIKAAFAMKNEDLDSAWQNFLEEIGFRLEEKKSIDDLLAIASQ